MVLKKINAALGMVSTLLFIEHLVSGSILVITDSLEKNVPIPAIVLAVLLGIHAILSICMITINTDATAIKYPSSNAETIVQRVSGFLLLIIMFGHIMTAINLGASKGVSIAFAILLSLTAICGGAHFGVSVPRALMTLGAVKSEKAFKRVHVVSTALEIVLDVVAVVATIMMIVRL
ncbi:MAG: hypothetical protein MJ236_03655 [Clostridia bacterium]|nr:hypothetical protein [Clostridia bacterium]